MNKIKIKLKIDFLGGVKNICHAIYTQRFRAQSVTYFKFNWITVGLETYANL